MFMAFAPVAVSTVFALEDPRLKKWLGYPAVILLLMWLFSALWLYDAAWGDGSRSLQATTPKPWFTRRRRIALVVALAGLMLWILGFEYVIGGWPEVVMLLLSSTMVFLGTINVVYE
jgi:hypothetical protein